MQIYRKDRNKFEINFSAFHSTYEVDITTCSARELDQLEKPRKNTIKKVNIMDHVIQFQSILQVGSILTAGMENDYSASLTSPSFT